MVNRNPSSIRERHAYEMRRVVSRWEQSGLTQSSYCRQHGITLRQFHYWRKMAKPELRGRAALMEVEVVPGPAGCSEIELRLPGGVVAVLSGDTSARVIRRLLRAARSC
jgi:transposase-like protein